MKISPPKKVWLVHGSHTGGHASAARALKKALDKREGVESEILNLAETSSASTAAEVALKGPAAMRQVRSFLFDQQFAGNPALKWLTDQVMAQDAMRQTDFLERVEREKPDLIVSTMSATNSLLNALQEQGALEVPVHSVLTDFKAHQVWAQENIARYYVATDEVKADLQRFGVKGETIEVTGIPIDDAFSAPSKTPQEAREELGLDPALPTVLTLGGSLGMGDLPSLVRTLDAIPGSFQLVTITGRNQRLAQELEELDTRHPLTVTGYVTNMASFIEAADLIVSKPGGLTCSEVLAKGKPLLLLEAEGGLEGHMVEGLKATGAALAGRGVEGLKQQVEELLSDQPRREKLQQRALQVGRPDAAAAVAGSIHSYLVDTVPAAQ